MVYPTFYSKALLQRFSPLAFNLKSHLLSANAAQLLREQVLCAGEF